MNTKGNFENTLKEIQDAGKMDEMQQRTRDLAMMYQNEIMDNFNHEEVALTTVRTLEETSKRMGKPVSEAECRKMLSGLDDRLFISIFTTAMQLIAMIQAAQVTKGGN